LEEVTMAISGRCLCGGARYEIVDAPGDVSHCHCSMCHRDHGAALGNHAAGIERVAGATAKGRAWAPIGATSRDSLP
jgi:hypothetical protein